MTPIQTTFTHLRTHHTKALIPFIMGGDPSLGALEPLLITLEAHGANLIEVGIPFSDPLADGPTIQAASARALARGATPASVLAAVASARRALHVPLICLSYWNPILQFGHTTSTSPTAEPFLNAAAASGISGLIVPDLPVEAADELSRDATRYGIDPIFLVAPTSSSKRVRMIARAGRGFLYYVSVTGTTGARKALPAELLAGVRRVKRVTRLPVCVGFGLSTPAQVTAVSRVADGVIVGSALIQVLETSGPRQKILQRAGAFVARLRHALDHSHA